MICPDCKGKKVYVGLNKVTDCATCRATGEVNDYGGRTLGEVMDLSPPSVRPADDRPRDWRGRAYARNVQVTGGVLTWYPPHAYTVGSMHEGAFRRGCEHYATSNGAPLAPHHCPFMSGTLASIWREGFHTTRREVESGRVVIVP